MSKDNLLEVKNLVIIGEMIMRAAAVRTESRVNHFRSDFPRRDDARWLKYLVLQKKNDQMVFQTEDLPKRN